MGERAGWVRAVALGLLAGLGGCAVARFDVPGASDEGAYAAAHPYYAEFCALSQIKKKPGFGADIVGGIGGHSVFYLNGACRAGEGYPVLEVCQPGEGDGVGLSENSHFSNAKWVAVPGRDFFYRGGLRAGVGVTRESYAGVQREAKRLGLYDQVAFHAEVFDDMPAGWSREDWKYEMSVGTDYGIGLARGRDCARIPVTRGQMGQMVEYLNQQNAPYRSGARVFHWSVFADNCIHLAHNALAAAGLMPAWPIERPLVVALFDFPVPKNEFVNLMRQTNDDWRADPGAAYWDVPERGALLQYGRMASFPGGLAEAAPIIQPNAVYDLDVKLIFYDEPTLGHYQANFDSIFQEPRYTDAGVNRAYFAGLARQAAAARKPLAWWLARPPYREDPAGFALVYAAYYRMVDELAR